MTEIYVCVRSKPHRSLYPIRAAEIPLDQVLEYRTRTEVRFDGTDVLLLSLYPMRFSDVRFLIWDIREMRKVPKRSSYTQVMLDFMKQHFGYTWYWSEWDGAVDALRITYQRVLEIDASNEEWWEQS